MNKIKLFGVLITLICAITMLPINADAKTLYLGGTYAITGPYAEDTKVILAAYEDYAKYVNETKKMAPWSKEKFPADINLEVLWRDDELQPPKALSIYEELKAKGILVYRISSSPVALALKDRMNKDSMGATGMVSGPFLMTPPQTIFTLYPIYSDCMAAVADWFKANWKEKRKPRVAYLTADNAMGKAIIIPKMEEYLKKLGFELVGSQFVPLIPATPPTTQLMWLKENKVDLALGIMIGPGTEATIKEAVRLDMGPNRGHKIVFAVSNTHLDVMVKSLGPELSHGVVIPGDMPPRDYQCNGIKFFNELQNKYRPDKKISHIMYAFGMVEAMIQVEALRLALQKVPFEKLTPAEVLKNGFYRIKNLDTGELTGTPLTYGPGKIEGCGSVVLWQTQKGKVVKIGRYPLRHLY